MSDTTNVASDPTGDEVCASQVRYNKADKTKNKKKIIEVEEMKVRVPLENGGACPKCQQEGINFMHVKATELAKHFEEKHLSVRASWECTGCNKIWDKIHAWSCHWPHCKKKIPEELAYKCENCEKSFETRVGLSQHERHEHPVVRNSKRIAEASREPGKKGALLNIWTEEEIVLLKRLCK